MLSQVDFCFFIRQPTDRGRIKKKLCTAERSESRCFRKPLVPADQCAHFPISRVVSLKTKITGSEVELFVVKRIVGNVHLAILAHNLTRLVDDDSGVVINTGCSLFEE